MAPPISTSPATDFGRQLATIYPTPAEIKIQNEDCLFLNVWTPGLGGGTRRPVMVWLHGGRLRLRLRRLADLRRR